MHMPTVPVISASDRNVQKILILRAVWWFWELSLATVAQPEGSQWDHAKRFEFAYTVSFMIKIFCAVIILCVIQLCSLWGKQDARVYCYK